MPSPSTGKKKYPVKDAFFSLTDKGLTPAYLSKYSLNWNPFEITRSERQYLGWKYRKLVKEVIHLMRREKALK